nr:bulb-type lectin domain-containing protein [Tanacetum cinerariifolium]
MWAGLDIDFDQDTYSWNKDTRQLTVNSFEGFIRFIKLAKNNKVVLKHREIFRECFESMLKWFHNTYIEGDVTKLMAPTIGGYEICPFDLYKLVKCFGGYERLNYKKKWDEVSLGFGFSGLYGLGFKEIYVHCLLCPSRTSCHIVDESSSSLSKRHHTSVDNNNMHFATLDSQSMPSDVLLSNVRSSSRVHVSCETNLAVELVASLSRNRKRTRDVMSRTTVPDVVACSSRSRKHIRDVMSRTTVSNVSGNSFGVHVSYETNLAPELVASSQLFPFHVFISFMHNFKYRSWVWKLWIPGYF